MFRILMAGAGGVGGYFGGMLAASENPQLEVTFLARGGHRKAMKKNGLKINSTRGHFHVQNPHVTDKISGDQDFDAIFICVKTYQTQAILAEIKKGVGPETLLLSLQNGLNRHELLRREFGEKNVAGGLCYLGAFVESPGIIRHEAAGKLIFGEFNASVSPRLKKLQSFFQDAGLECELTEEIVRVQWQKLIWNVGFNGPSALLDVEVGDLLKRGEQRVLIESLMKETVAVAKAHRISLPKDFPETVMAYSEKEFSSVKTSMVWDRRLGRPTEWPIFYGYISEEGTRLGIPTPANDLVKNLLEEMDPT